MAIECYYDQCQYHCSKQDPEEGPFCDEAECRATEEQLVRFEARRVQWLARHAGALPPQQ